jgi:hypothetical protein
MFKRSLFAILAIFILWSFLDFVIHGIILQGTYAATPDLWRPMEEMKMGLIRFVVLVSSIVFVTIYACFVAEKGLRTGAAYGVLYGIGAGIAMGYGTYSAMPIPYAIALTWFLGTLAEKTLAGLILGWFLSANRRPSP